MQVKIISPCPQDFTHIKIAMLSRQCDLCNKPVIDFTKMSREEIITYLLEHSEENVCGRMNRPQIDIHHDDLPVIIETLKRQGGNRSFLLLALICMSLVSCNSPEPAETQINVKNPIHQPAMEGKLAITDTTSAQRANNKKSVPKVNVIPPEVLPSPDPSPEPYPVIEGEIAYIEEPPVSHSVTRHQEEEILSYAEVMPEYPGGVKELFSFIQKNLKYPEMEKEAGIEGNVYVQFVVSKEGVVYQPKILRGVSGAPGFDKEVMRIVRAMPNWMPGENAGKKVNVFYTMPVKFRLD